MMNTIPGFLILLAGMLLTQCVPWEQATVPPAPTEPPELPLFTDENHVMQGICFEAAFDAAGRAFTLGSPAALASFYELADHSRLCRRPVERGEFDFEDGRVLAGIWSAGRGCTAYHELLEFSRDDDARTLTIRLRLVTEGECNYELVRPFWIGIPDATEYDITMIVEP
jgi:hypothetical protein